MACLIEYLAFPSFNASLCAIKTNGLILTLLTYSLQSIIFTLKVVSAAPMIKSSALHSLVFKIPMHGVCDFKMIKMQMFSTVASPRGIGWVRTPHLCSDPS